MGCSFMQGAMGKERNGTNKRNNFLNFSVPPKNNLSEKVTQAHAQNAQRKKLVDVSYKVVT